MSQSAQNIDASLLAKWQPFRGPFTRWPRTSDALLAFLSLVLTLRIWSGDRADDTVGMAFGAFILFLLGNASLYWRRQFPDHVHGTVLAASALAMLLGYIKGPIFGLAITLYGAGRYSTDDRWSFAGLAAALVLLVGAEIAFSTLATDDVFEFALPVAIWYAGRRVRARGEYLRLLKERAEQLEREQQLEADRAVAAERTRIARELHDIVAHQVSLMTVQAGAAKTIVDSDPEAATNAMRSVEAAGRQALNELRHLLGVLRPDSDNGELAPQPGRSDLHRLTAEMELAGVEVSLQLDDLEETLPARIDLAIYRIVQESLTNVLKHAGAGARATVRVRIATDDVLVDIEDDGVGVTRLPGSGQGIAGMRERAESLGGSLDAGARGEGGFFVAARLPILEESS